MPFAGRLLERLRSTGTSLFNSMSTVGCLVGGLDLLAEDDLVVGSASRLDPGVGRLTGGLGLRAEEGRFVGSGSKLKFASVLLSQLPLSREFLAANHFAVSSLNSSKFFISLLYFASDQLGL